MAGFNNRSQQDGPYGMPQTGAYHPQQPAGFQPNAAMSHVTAALKNLVPGSGQQAAPQRGGPNVYQGPLVGAQQQQQQQQQNGYYSNAPPGFGGHLNGHPGPQAGADEPAGREPRGANSGRRGGQRSNRAGDQPPQNQQGKRRSEQQQQQPQQQEQQQPPLQRRHLSGGPGAAATSEGHAAPGAANRAAAAPPAAPVTSQQSTGVRFVDFNIAQETKRAITEGFGYEFCFQVQAQAIPACLQGSDVMAKAKTGSGKTVAFMIPAIETILQLRKTGQRMPGVKVLVLSPTRELASQIHAEAEKLLAFHRPPIKSMVAVGGVKVDKHTRALLGACPDVLVATPGRCLELLTDAGPDVRSKFGGVRVLVMDEADTLLDMGFRPAISKILAALPPRDQRQTLLFSATFPQEVSQLANLALRPGSQMVDCVGGEVQTNTQVEQKVMVVPMEQHINAMVALLDAHTRQEPDFKVVVFFPTARMTQMYANLAELAGFPVLEMHSRKSQAHRDRMSASFRSGSRVMMFSSDVSARGVDYPDVTMVLQVGAASDKAQYIHRVGRTGRAGKAGEALLLLSDFETAFVQALSDLPMQRLQPPTQQQLDGAATKVTQALRRAERENLERAYVTWLGYYRTHLTCKRLPPVQLVELANKYARVLGMTTPPAVSAQAVGKMGLKGVPGLIVEKFRR